MTSLSLGTKGAGLSTHGLGCRLCIALSCHCQSPFVIISVTRTTIRLSSELVNQPQSLKPSAQAIACALGATLALFGICRSAAMLVT